MAELPGLDGRGARHDIQYDQSKILLIDESYNANPASMAATIAELGHTSASRRLVVLGAMKELGNKSDDYHLALATDLQKASVDYAVLVGPEMDVLAKNLTSGVEGPKKFDHCATANEALELLRLEIQSGDVILIKGSNSMGLSKIVTALRNRIA
jgi:UDP-N-acetylmuramoyl-tripeptide--D-alanyl-D-alanine ligase